MNAAEEQVLEHALQELLDETQTDLGERVLHRLREEERVVDEARARRRRLLWSAAAAATVILCSWLAIESLRRPAELGTDTAVATSSGLVGVLRAGEAEVHLGDAFGPGDTLVNGPKAESRIVLASGEELDMGRCSMLALERDARGVSIVPLLGSVTLRSTKPSDVRVRTSVGTLALPSPGELRVDRPAEGYDLEHPERFQRLAQEIHMKTAIPVILTIATVVQGTAMLETESGDRPLVAGESLQDREAATYSQRVEEKLMEEVGTWDVTITDVSRTGESAGSFTGVEVCRAGPGNKWLLTESTFKRGERVFSVLTVVGFRGDKGQYTGSLVDSFGGEFGMLRGTVEDEMQTRVLQMYSAESTPGFDRRWIMRWEGPDQRHTQVEGKRGEEWVLMSEMVHRRRK